ncbi:MAG: S46 family peptidase [Prolixibacteraceae bacterium]
MRKLFALLFILLIAHSTYAVEGMWIPTLLKKYNIEEMQKMGFKLTAEDIYDVNHSSMKDAVVLFGSGCTGEVISGDGLLITNHHCGFGQIQKHSTLSHDYLTDGFWAKNRSEELTNPGLSVQFLVRMEEVSKAVMKDVKEDTADDIQKKQIAANIDVIKKEYSGKGIYQVDVKPLYYGNQYFVYVYEVFKDVRLVGAPPVSIGKFGGDTDNWVWPRHTGDFSLFRIYANKDNKPAAYSPDNVPYHPKKFFPINLKGIREGDFTMVFGFPGTTQEYIPSMAVKLLIEKSNPNKVDARTIKLDILEKQMSQDPKVRIQYASKYAGISNSWKKWQGETNGLNRLKAVDKKQSDELAFSTWFKQDSEREKKYGKILENFQKNYSELTEIQIAYDLYNETVLRGPEIFGLISRFDLMGQAMADTAKYNKAKKSLADFLPGYFKDYDAATDRKLLPALLKIYVERVDAKYLPEYANSQKFNLLNTEYIQSLFNKSPFSDSTKIKSLLANYNAKSLKKLKKDKLYQLFTSLAGHYNQNIDPVYQKLSQAILKTQKLYMAAILDMKRGERLMADANLTLRVTYGKVEGFEPKDGVYYQYFTTLKGMIEKQNPDIADYVVPEKLKKLYLAKDYGKYANSTGEVPIAFCASNHTTGGNSGSPVINADGELIGVNFDRCWEGTMSDVLFDPERCRNIALDIRYALFIIDKFAGAGYLLKEMQLIN